MCPFNREKLSKVKSGHGFYGVAEPISLHYGEHLKQAALLFDAIVTPPFEMFMPFRNLCSQERLAELDWLSEQGVIDSSKDWFELAEDEAERLSSRIDEAYNAMMVQGLRNLNPVFLELLARDLADLTRPQRQEALLMSYMRSVYEETLPMSRLLAERIRLLDCDAVALFHTHDNYTDTFKPGRNAVIEVVLESMPTPDDSTGWEAIMEYRHDPDSKSKMLGIRKWISDVVRMKLSAKEAREQLDWLTHVYEEHMKLHCAKINLGTFETVLTTTAECLENLVRVNWGKAAKAIFEVRRRPLELKEKELLAPGRELAYIVATREKFAAR